MDGSPPFIPDYYNELRWRWQWWKFDIDPDTLFTELADKYNTVPCRVQCREAFHADVSSIIIQANDVDDFHRRMAARRDQSLREIRESWETTRGNARLSSIQWKDLKLRQTFYEMAHDLSFDLLVRFLDAHNIEEALKEWGIAPVSLTGHVNPAPPARPAIVPEPPLGSDPTETPSNNEPHQPGSSGTLELQLPQEQPGEGEQRHSAPSSSTIKGPRAQPRSPASSRRHGRESAPKSPILTRDARVGRRGRHSPQKKQTSRSTRASRRIAGLEPELHYV